jgi:hypothetical protein
MVVPADVFEPDLIITADEGTDLVMVVEVKRCLTHLAETESQLREYMLAMRCPFGLLATPKTLRLYHDQYLSASEDSVKLVGVYAAPPDWAIWEYRQNSTQTGGGFEDAVQGWLERLKTESGLRLLPPDFREAVEHYLIPALNQGAVRAAHPRAA